jgi:hypothetical protein
LKRDIRSFEPVGEENFYAVIEINPGTVMILLVDAEGNAKAMSAYIGKIRARTILEQMEASGIKKYEGILNFPL